MIRYYLYALRYCNATIAGDTKARSIPAPYRALFIARWFRPGSHINCSPRRLLYSRRSTWHGAATLRAFKRAPAIAICRSRARTRLFIAAAGHAGTAGAEGQGGSGLWLNSIICTCGTQPRLARVRCLNFCHCSLSVSREWPLIDLVLTLIYIVRRIRRAPRRLFPPMKRKREHVRRFFRQPSEMANRMQ